ncbi:hypothetical protein K7432_009402 [Basidiobolus ranarum]|uniref:Uncharacterized protein n=1 Tax=Basidiobolus ranarum TaxID=34480 RepID=A0ABR2WQB7_9FUNG
MYITRFMPIGILLLLNSIHGDQILVLEPKPNAKLTRGNKVELIYRLLQQDLAYLDFVRVDLLDSVNRTMLWNIASTSRKMDNWTRAIKQEWFIPESLPLGKYTLKFHGNATFTTIRKTIETLSKSSIVPIVINRPKKYIFY